jgi:hypothetical protein
MFVTECRQWHHICNDVGIQRREPTVGRFNFDIDPGAEFTYDAKITRSTRDLLKSTEAKPRRTATLPDTITLAVCSDRRLATQNRASRSIRRHDTQQVVVNRRLVHVKNSNYRNFKISTARSSDSAWVAYFERLDGRPVFWEGKARSMMKTESYSSETLAIADAQISIDDFLASQPDAQAVNE